MLKKRTEESLILRLIFLGQLLQRRRDTISQNLGVSTQQWIILLHLAFDPNIPFFEKKTQKKPMMASEIAESLGVSRPNITNLLNVLIEKDLVDQVDDDFDKRRKRLTLSPKGEALIESLQPQREYMNSQLFAAFSDEERHRFLQMVDHCIGFLEQTSGRSPINQPTTDQPTTNQPVIEPPMHE
jgi:DNA-binding MarR family transcriptional regulator